MLLESGSCGTGLEANECVGEQAPVQIPALALSAIGGQLSFSLAWEEFLTQRQLPLLAFCPYSRAVRQTVSSGVGCCQSGTVPGPSYRAQLSGR